MNPNGPGIISRMTQGRHKQEQPKIETFEDQLRKALMDQSNHSESCHFCEANNDQDRCRFHKIALAERANRVAEALPSYDVGEFMQLCMRGVEAGHLEGVIVQYEERLLQNREVDPMLVARIKEITLG